MIDRERKRERVTEQLRVLITVFDLTRVPTNAMSGWCSGKVLAPRSNTGKSDSSSLDKVPLTQPASVNWILVNGAF